MWRSGLLKGSIGRNAVHRLKIYGRAGFERPLPMGQGQTVTATKEFHSLLRFSSECPRLLLWPDDELFNLAARHFKDRERHGLVRVLGGVAPISHSPAQAGSVLGYRDRLSQRTKAGRVIVQRLIIEVGVRVVCE